VDSAAVVARLSLLLLLAGCSSAYADEVVSIHDGDTFTMNGQRWRLWGVDAPELQQTCLTDREIPCGVMARDVLQALTTGKNIECEWHGTSYNRSVGLCNVDGNDLSLEMVWRGWALDWQKYSNGIYAKEQADAKANKRGLWATEFVEPWTWRKSHPH
jgi:endonuclease YncB( thermonuclease family)